MRYLLAPISVASLLLSGCSSVVLGDTFEGANDFRIVPTPEKKQSAKADVKPSTDSVIDLTTTSRFQKQDEKVAAPIEPGDPISINIQTMWFDWFPEGIEQRAMNGLLGSATKGEIVVIANVSEDALAPGGRDAEGKFEGKVVYYGNDVYFHQFANEFNIPVYGPVRWTGKPLTIEIWVLELDQPKNNYSAALLETLANLAKSFTGLPFASDVLESLGTALLKSNKDDVMGHFKLTLVPHRGDSASYDPILQESTLIVGRSSDHTQAKSRKPFPFDDCKLEAKSGRILCNGDNTNPSGNYMTLALRKPTGDDYGAIGLDFSDLVGRLSAASKIGGDGTESIAQFRAALSKAESVGDAEKLLSKLAKPGQSDAVREYDALKLAKLFQCALLSNEPDPSDEVKERLKECPGGIGISMAEFDRLTRKAIAEFTVSADDFSSATLLGDSTADGIQAARKAMASKLVLRPPA